MFMSFEIRGLGMYVHIGIGRNFEMSSRQRGLVYGMSAQK